MPEGADTSLALTADREHLSEFFSLLQQGVLVTLRVGLPLGELLRQELGIIPEYVASRITTIFLDGRAIDDVNTAIVRPGSVLALSGAMPGLVGATMRRGGFYAAMRGGISYRETACDRIDTVARIRLKLFNLLLPELGPLILEHGILATRQQVADFLTTASCLMATGGAVLVNGKPVGCREALNELGEGEGLVHLKVMLVTRSQ